MRIFVKYPGREVVMEIYMQLTLLVIITHIWENGKMKRRIMMHKKKFVLIQPILILIILVFYNTTFAKKIGELDDILKPFQIKVSKNLLLISDQYQVFYFSLNPLKLFNKVGGKGEGPSEFWINPIINILPDKVLAFTPSVIISFSKTGEFLNQTRFNNGIMWNIDMVKENYVISLAKYQTKGTYRNFTIMDSNFEEIKTIHSILRESPTHMKKVKRFLVTPLNKFICYKNDIYVVSEKNEGLIISVFDYKGDLIRTISRDHERIEISNSDKERLLTEYKNIPAVKKKWESLNRLFDYIFPEFYPAVQDFFIDDDKIYIKTYKTSQEGTEFIIMDLKGNLKGNAFLPDIKNLYCDISDNKFYYISDNEIEETWELYAIDIL